MPAVVTGGHAAGARAGAGGGAALCRPPNRYMVRPLPVDQKTCPVSRRRTAGRPSWRRRLSWARAAGPARLGPWPTDAAGVGGRCCSSFEPLRAGRCGPGAIPAAQAGSGYPVSSCECSLVTTASRSTASRPGPPGCLSWSRRGDYVSDPDAVQHLYGPPGWGTSGLVSERRLRAHFGIDRGAARSAPFRLRVTPRISFMKTANGRSSTGHGDGMDAFRPPRTGTIRFSQQLSRESLVLE